MEEVVEFLKEAGGINQFLSFVMAELEYCDDMIHNENLSASNYIYWKTRKDTLIEVRDQYCNFKNKKH